MTDHDSDESRFTTTVRMRDDEYGGIDTQAIGELIRDVVTA